MTHVKREMIERLLCSDGQPCTDPEGCGVNYCARKTGMTFAEHFNAWLDEKLRHE